MAKTKLPVIFEPSLRRVRVEFNGETIAQSDRAMLLRESSYELHYFFPLEDVRQEFLVESDFTNESKYKGNSQHWTVKVGDQEAENAAWTISGEPNKNRPDLRGYLTFEWNDMDHWYEEAEEVIGHPRDPYHRVDTVLSDRHIRVEVNDETVADTHRAIVLFETGLPARYYIPREDVQMNKLVDSDLHTICPYKGVASYYSIQTAEGLEENLVWYYPEPFPESIKITDAVAFYNEKVDIYIDGELEDRPRTVFA